LVTPVSTQAPTGFVRGVPSRGYLVTQCYSARNPATMRAQRASNQSPEGTKYFSLGQGRRPPPQVQRPKAIPSLFFHPVWRAPPSARQTGWKKREAGLKRLPLRSTQGHRGSRRSPGRSC
jgi:hypothetical protein